MTYKITLQNPKPSEDAALKNFSFDWTNPTAVNKGEVGHGSYGAAHHKFPT